MSVRSIIRPPATRAIIPHQSNIATYRPPCDQYRREYPGRLVYTGRNTLAGNCSPNADGSYDFFCHTDRFGRRVCQGSNHTSASSPDGICCPQYTPRPTPGGGALIPQSCCVQDTNSCAICLTNFEGNRTGNVASNHQRNMERCRNNCFGVQTAGLGSPETRLLANNVYN